MVLVSDIDAIKALSAESARSILIYLCADAQVCQKASRLAKQIGPRPPVKRRAEDPIAVCVQCDEVFNPDNNKAQDCRYHSEGLEVDYEGYFWADHDERCHGPIDTADMREKYPDGFEWTCCGDLGSAGGCKRGRHQADPCKSKKGSYSSESEDEVEEDDDTDDDEEDDEEDNEDQDRDQDRDG